MFKMILSVISGLETKLLKGDFEEVNMILSRFNSDKNKITIVNKETELPDIEKLIQNAKELSITLPDLTATASQNEE